MILTHIGTLFLYISIIATSSLFGFLSQKKAFNKIKLRLFPFFLSFLLFAIFSFFSDNGPDYQNYYLLFSRLTWGNYATFYDSEPFFNFLSLFVMNLFAGSIPIAIAFLKTITLVFVYLSLFIARNKIKIGYSVLAYGLLCYLPSFYLIPMLLATSLVFLAFAISVTRIKWGLFISLILLLFAAQIHNSAYFAILVFVMSLFFRNNANLNIAFSVITISLFFFLFIFADDIFIFLSNAIASFHYSSYFTGLNINTGALWLLIYVPLIIVTILIFSFYKDTKTKYLILLFVVSSAFVRLLSYRFSVIGRLEFFLIPLFCFFFSRIMCCKNKNLFTKYNSLVIASIVVYTLFRGYLLISSEMEWMDFYHFANPFAG